MVNFTDVTPSRAGRGRATPLPKICSGEGVRHSMLAICLSRRRVVSPCPHGRPIGRLAPLALAASRPMSPPSNLLDWEQWAPPAVGNGGALLLLQIGESETPCPYPMLLWERAQQSPYPLVLREREGERGAKCVRCFRRNKESRGERPTRERQTQRCNFLLHFILCCNLIFCCKLIQLYQSSFQN